ncbi:MAG: discoidin domain-containing protein, partial [Duncaniella sp.]|nr:discoidin domain-containing protein [Duncaniella sp.]
QTLYMPGCWLHEGENEIVVFDVIGPESPEVSGLHEPVLNRRRTLPSRIGTPTGPVVAGDRVGQMSVPHLEPKADGKDSHKSVAPAKADDFTVVHTGSLSRDNSWQHITFDTPVKGRYLCIEMLSNHAPSPESAIAEIYITDTDGKRLSREDWSILSVDSEDIDGGNHTADKLYDLQESTFWQSAPAAPLPHRLVIDLGALKTFAGLDWLQRMEPTFPGAVNSYRVSVR